LENTERTLTLRFSLTRLQRVLNPIDSFGQTVISVSGLGLLIVAAGIAIFMNTWSTAIHEGLWPATWKCLVTTMVVAIGIAVVWFCIVGKQVIAAYYMLFSDSYINTVALGDQGSLYFGVDELEVGMKADDRILNGVLGTYIITSGAYRIVIPKTAIDFHGWSLAAALKPMLFPNGSIDEGCNAEEQFRLPTSDSQRKPEG
jgi:hypothetical protein